jgi:hypothetical protein
MHDLVVPVVALYGMIVSSLRVVVACGEWSVAFCFRYNETFQRVQEKETRLFCINLPAGARD